MALTFTCTSNHWICGGSGTGLNFTASFTIEAWICTCTCVAGCARSIMNRLQCESWDQGYALGLIGGCVSLYTINYPLGTEICSTSTVPNATWTHVAGVHDSVAGISRLYINGTDVTPATCAADTPSSCPTNYICIGSNSSGSSESFNGRIDELRAWSGARTQEQICTFMYKRIIPDGSCLKAVWRMNEFSGTCAYDISGNANNGTFCNMTAANYVDGAPIMSLYD